MLIFSKLFIWHLSRGIVRTESAEKESTRKRHLRTTFKLRMKSFCRQRAGLEVLKKVTSKADRWKESESIFTKIDFLLYFVSIMSLLSKLLTQASTDKNNSFSTYRLYTNDTFSSILFQPITAWLFPIGAPLHALSILTIPVDKSQMKSFKNTNILIKVKLCCLKNFFLEKSALIWKKHFSKKINFFFWKKKFCFGKNAFFLKKIFFNLWRIKVQVHNWQQRNVPCLKV